MTMPALVFFGLLTLNDLNLNISTGELMRLASDKKN